MADQTFISIDLVDPNPYQTRIEYKPGEIGNLALSIAQDGLIQPPVYRFSDGRYQVGVGHKRTEAYRLLNAVQSGFEDGVPPELISAVKASETKYFKIPATVEHLSDEQMFRFVVTENAQRSDLSPIEEMMAMKRAKADFNYSSEQIGALFGKEGATVRGLIRLGDLPKSVQIKIHEGKLSQGAARYLLSLVKLLPESLDQVVEEILDGEDAEGQVDFALRNSVKIRQLYESTTPWMSKKIAAKHFPELTLTQAKKHCDFTTSSHQDEFVYQNLVETIQKGKKIEVPYLGDEVNAKVAHLVNPPACTACPMSVVVDRSRYCGIKFCYERKQSAWGKSLVEKVSKDTGIAIYNAETDGKFIELSPRNDDHRTLVKDRGADLRLGYFSQSMWNNFEEIDGNIHVLLVGETAQKSVAKAAKKQSKEISYGSAEYKQREAAREAARKAILQFAWDHAVPAFQTLVAGLAQVDFLERFVHNHTEGYRYDYKKVNKSKPATKQEKITLLQKRLTLASLFNDFDYPYEQRALDSKTPVQKFAAYAQGLAKTWGVTLPKTFMTLAQEADVDLAPVSAETPKKKK